MFLIFAEIAKNFLRTRQITGKDWCGQRNFVATACSKAPAMRYNRGERKEATALADQKKRKPEAPCRGLAAPAC